MMEYGIIKRKEGEITDSEWQSVIERFEFLQKMEPRAGINPFTGEEVVFKRDHASYFVVDNETKGNLSLENGEIQTNCVPLDYCVSIADALGADVYEES